MAEAYTYSYEPAWQKGDVISSLRLNNIENGIRRSLNLISDLNYWNQDAPQEVTEEDAGKHYFNDFAQDRTIESLTQDEGLIHVTTHTIAIKSYQIVDDAISYDSNDPSGAGYKVVKTNASGIIPSSLLPSYVDDVLEFPTKNDFPSGSTDSNPDDAHAPSGPETGKIYVDLSTGRSYRWGGSAYTEVGVIHLDYNDDNSERDQNINGVDSANQTAIFGTGDEKYVKKVTQLDGQIKVEHALFNPTINTTSSTGSAGDLFSITVGGNTSNTFTPTLASTAVYGVTKLNSNTVNSGTITDDEALAVTTLGVHNIINTLDNTFTASTAAFINQISEENGIISATERSFSPILNHTASTTTSAVPYLSISIAGNESSAVALDTATTANYGVTVLSNTQDSTNSTAAATPQGVWDAINQLDSTVTVNSTGYITGITQTNGKLTTATTAAFEPSLSITAASSNSAQELNLTVAGNTGASAITLATATTGVYGVTKLSDATDNTSSDIAATSKAVKDSLNAAKAYTDNQINTLDANITGTPGTGKTLTALSQTNGIMSATFSNISITKSQISDLTAAELLTPAQKNSIELFDDLINNFTFNLTLQLPTEVTWSRDDNTGVVTAVPKTFSTDTTVSYQMNDGNGWVAYDSTQSYEGNHTFKAHVSRSHIFNGTTHTAEADISETYEYIQESAPEGD